MDTITGMRTFCAVANEVSFTKAAKRLAISPALTSKYIGQLEARLGVRLLNRTTRSLSLTEQGHAYLIRCLQLVEEFDELEAVVADQKLMPAGTLNISAPKSFGENYLPCALAQFLAKYPGILIDLNLTDRPVNIIEEGYDLALRAGIMKDSSLIARKILPAELLLCATPQYLAEFGTPESPNDLLKHQCIVDTNFNFAENWPFLINGEKVSVRVDSRLRVNSARAVRQIILGHGGIAICPNQAVGADIDNGDLIAVMNVFNPVEIGLYAVYPHKRYLANKVRLFVDFLVDFFAHDNIAG